MVGSPHVPLKYRRKGTSDYRAHSSDLDVPFHSSPYSCSSEYSLPQSPTIYSSSSSVAPSSPVRSLYTPEPLTPLPEPHIARSPKSPKLSSRKGFWEVAFNYGPDFPYKARHTVQTSAFAQEQFVIHRRNSSAPTLVSDVELSEYSEDNDLFHADDDVTDEETTPNIVTIVNAKDGPALDERHVCRFPEDDIVHTTNSEKVLDGEIDVAAVLLDLRRQVRFGPVESRPEDLAINCKASLSLDLAEHPSSLTDQSCQVDEEVTALESETNPTSNLCESITTEDVKSPDSGSYEDQNTLHEENYTETPKSDIGVSTGIVEDQHCTTEGRGCITPQIVPLGLDTSGNIAARSTGSMEASHSSNESESLGEMAGCAITDGHRGVQPIAGTGFSDPLTPLSCALSDSGLSELTDTELLTEPSSPMHDDWELTGPTDGTRYPGEVSIVLSRSSSPVPGPSDLRSADSDHSNRSTGSRPRNNSKKGRARSVVHSAKSTKPAESSDIKSKKRGRSVSAVESRPSSPTPSASCSDVPKPRKKRTKRTNVTTVLARGKNGSEATVTVDSSSSLPTYSIPPQHDSASSAPQDFEMNIVDEDADVRDELCGCLVQAMALSRASSMPASSLIREVLRENPHLAHRRSKSDWLDLVLSVLESNDVFGRIDRKGFDADDKPLEAQWFYVPENDPDQDRATLLREMMPKKRSETKKDKQYFFKPLGKISRWDPEDAL